MTEVVAFFRFSAAYAPAPATGTRAEFACARHEDTGNDREGDCTGIHSITSAHRACHNKANKKASKKRGFFILKQIDIC
jgi:hypothetical protein